VLSKILVYTPNCVYLPKLWLYHKIQFISQTLWLYRLYPKKSALSPKFEVISQKSFCTPKIWGYLPKLRVVSNSAYTQKIRDISQKWCYIPKLVVCLGVDMAVPKRRMSYSGRRGVARFKTPGQLEGQPRRLNYSLGENQWTGLRKNLQQTMVFTIIYESVL
jgi:hypothetical protein